MLALVLILTALFIIGLGARVLFPKLCTICFAVSLGWLIGFPLGFDPVVLAMLMGGSAVGLMYYLSARLPEKFAVFKLPYLLASFIIITLAVKREFDWNALLAVIGVWVIFTLIFLLRNGRSKRWFKVITECCKNW